MKEKTEKRILVNYVYTYKVFSSSILYTTQSTMSSVQYFFYIQIRSYFLRGKNLVWKKNYCDVVTNKKQTVSINLTLLYIPKKKNFKHIYDIALWFRHCIQISYSYSLQAIFGQNDTLMYVSQCSMVTLIFLMQLRCLTFICISKQEKILFYSFGWNNREI